MYGELGTSLGCTSNSNTILTSNLNRCWRSSQPEHAATITMRLCSGLKGICTVALVKR